jgi:hypothetical protein
VRIEQDVPPQGSGRLAVNEARWGPDQWPLTRGRRARCDAACYLWPGPSPLHPAPTRAHPDRPSTPRAPAVDTRAVSVTKKGGRPWFTRGVSPLVHLIFAQRRTELTQNVSNAEARPPLQGQLFGKIRRARWRFRWVARRQHNVHCVLTSVGVSAHSDRRMRRASLSAFQPGRTLSEKGRAQGVVRGAKPKRAEGGMQVHERVPSH